MKRDTKMNLQRAAYFNYRPAPGVLMPWGGALVAVGAVARMPKMDQPAPKPEPWRVTPKMLQRERRGLKLRPEEIKALKAGA